MFLIPNEYDSAALYSDGNNLISWNSELCALTAYS